MAEFIFLISAAATIIFVFFVAFNLSIILPSIKKIKEINKTIKMLQSEDYTLVYTPNSFVQKGYIENDDLKIEITWFEATENILELDELVIDKKVDSNVFLRLNDNSIYNHAFMHSVINRTWYLPRYTFMRDKLMCEIVRSAKLEYTKN